VGGWSDAKRNSDRVVHLGKRSESGRSNPSAPHCVCSSSCDMLLRRSNVDLVDAPLERGPSTFAGNPFVVDVARPGLSSSHVYRSQSPQRPSLDPHRDTINDRSWWKVNPETVARELGKRDTEVRFGGQMVGPSSYDPGRSKWVRQPERQSSVFASHSPRSRPLSARPSLTANVEDLPKLPRRPADMDELRQLVAPRPPGSAGVRWKSRPARVTGALRARELGQELQTDPDLCSLAAYARISPRTHRAGFAEGLDQRPLLHRVLPTPTARPSTPRALVRNLPFRARFKHATPAPCCHRLGPRCCRGGVPPSVAA
jgi:hypothetical protein